MNFLTKPVNDKDLIRAVLAGLKHASDRHREIAEVASLARRYALLTTREQEVMGHVIAGKLTKQIAADLGTREQNINFQRARLLEEMAVDSVPGLLRVAQSLGVEPRETPAFSIEPRYNIRRLRGAP